MNMYTDEEVKTVFGTYGFWVRKTLPGKLNYLNGIPELDRLDLLKLGEKGSVSNLECRPRGLTIEVIRGVWFFRAGLPCEDILYFVIEGQDHIFSQKQKSIIGRALVGGILFGPAGAVVDGTTSGENELVEAADHPENIVTMGYLEDGVIKQVFFSLTNEHRSEVTDFLNTHLPGKLRKAHEIVIQP